MKTITAPVILALTFVLFLILLMSSAPSQASPNQPEGQPLPEGTDIYTSRQMQEGIVSTSFQSIFGPVICTAYGDPFSPWVSTWAPGSYTYRYRIEIPADYPSNILRVELFDPDSMNSANNSATVIRTNAAIDAGGLSAFSSENCNSTNRRNVCLIQTSEAPNGSPVGGLSLDQVNPFWFLRVDENRGTVTPGNCGQPSSYTESYNTKTLFELYYFRENWDSSVQEVPLASYTGQDGTEAVDHETDLRWVSPGAEVGFGWDKDAPGVDVPVDPGSQTANGFEIDLSSEVPNIVTDPQTDDRTIYLDVTALSGGSENGFELWAGPPDYVNSVPSDVNARNVYVLNNPGSHNSRGITTYALGNLPQNSNANYSVDIPLTYIPATAAGQSIYISMFDTDAGARPPITFYLDTIAEDDWSLTFGNGGLDPDGISSSVRCLPGSCGTQWIDPPYEIKLPAGTKDCDFNNPTEALCTPFYGGRLLTRYQGGVGDTYGWEVSAPEATPQNPATYAGCEAFPIAIHEGIRSVTPPGQGASPYPNFADFTGPSNPPTYGSFIKHQDDVPLLQAKEGTVFKVQNGFGAGNFGWLQWNTGIVAGATTLENSLAWPGNSLDYTDHGDGGVVLPGQSSVVRGFVEPGDYSDTDLHIGDWTAASTGSVNSSSVRTTLEEHIALGRTLRLPIWNNSQSQGSNGSYQTMGFGIFRIQGYNMLQGSGEPWLLLEFIRWDESCGQNVVPLTNVTIAGPTVSPPNTPITFTANISPSSATQPISYTWQATDFAPIIQSNNISDTISFNWAITGTKTITVTAVNIAGLAVTNTHIITVSNLLQGTDLTIIGTPQLLTPLPIEVGAPVQFAVTVKNLGATAVLTQFFIDIFVNPSTINPDGIPVAESNGYNALSNLNGGESTTVIIALPAGLPFPNAPHQIYAMVDTIKSIIEVDETNNVSSALPFNANNFIVPPTNVSIDGPTASFSNENVTFIANIAPLTSTQAISYTWQATDFAPVVQSNNISDTISFNWASTGSKTITVTAENSGGIVTNTHTITVSNLLQGPDLTIIGTPQLVTSLPIKVGAAVEFAVTVKNLGNTAVSTQTFINLFVNPTTINPDGIPLNQSNGLNILYEIDPNESKTFNITLADGLPMPNTPHQIYAMVDSGKTVSETDENNNISTPLPFDASNFVPQIYIYLPTIIKN